MNSKDINKFINFYETIPNEKDMSLQYAFADKIGIRVPFRMAVIGSSGSKKTNFVMNLIHKMNCFQKIYLFAKVLSEPLYTALRKKMNKLMTKRKDKSLYFESSNIEDFPDFNVEETKSGFDRSVQNLFIIDDFLLEKQKNIIQSFIYGRKYNISIILISQSFFQIPPIVRKNVDYIVLKKINTARDLKKILEEYSGATPFSLKQLIDIYKYSQKNSDNGFLLDINNIDPTKRVRINFEPVPVPESDF